MGKRKKGNRKRRLIISDYRITIPKTIREKLGLKIGMLFEIEIVDEDKLLIKFFRV